MCNCDLREYFHWNVDLGSFCKFCFWNSDIFSWQPHQQLKFNVSEKEVLVCSFQISPLLYLSYQNVSGPGIECCLWSELLYRHLYLAYLYFFFLLVLKKHHFYAVMCLINFLNVQIIFLNACLDNLKYLQIYTSIFLGMFSIGIKQGTREGVLCLLCDDKHQRWQYPLIGSFVWLVI